MAKQVQWRRGSTDAHATFVGANGEITIDTDKKTVVVHDGVKAGGFPAITENSLELILEGKADKDNVVTSVAGKKGNVTLDKDDINGLSNVANISPEDMPISNAADERFDVIENDVALQKELVQVSKDFIGVVDRTKSTLTCVNSIVKLTFNADTTMYRRGQKLSFTNGTEFTLDVSGVREGSYIALNDSNNGLKLIGSIPNFFEDLLIAYVYRNQLEVVIFGDERHGAGIDTDWRRAQHLNVGAVLRSGGNLSLTLNDPTKLSLNLTTPLVIADEDLEHNIINANTGVPYSQVLSPVASIPYMYIGTSKYYEQSAKMTSPYPVGTTFAKYNNINTGTLVDAAEGNYICYFLIATNDMYSPIKLVVGRAAHETLESAIAENFDGLGLAMPEIVPLNKIIAQTSSSFTSKLKFISNYKITDRLSSVNTSFVPTSHGSLFGRDEANQHTMESITGLESTISGIENDITNISTSINSKISVPAAYMIYGGNIEVTNSILTNGFANNLHAGTNAVQNVQNGVDMNSQWGNDGSERFGGLVWIKSRNATYNNWLIDTVRGPSNNVFSNLTSANDTQSSLTSFNADGFTLSNLAQVNGSGINFVSWSFQTTHRRAGVTNQGKPFTEHYNPFTGFTIIEYEASGQASGHKIPHSLGRKLSLAHVKNTSAITDWVSLLLNLSVGDYVNLNLANAIANTTNAWSANDIDSVTIGGALNQNSNKYIMYGWSDSYFDSNSKLIGNYEIGTRFGDGVVGSKLKTRAKPLFIMFKRLDANGGWTVFDNKRDGKALYPNANAADSMGIEGSFVDDGFVFTNATNNFDINTNGARYEYMVVYDNDGGSGKSKYPRATDNSRLQINSSYVPYSNGITTNGHNTTISFKNETITVSNGLTLGKNYVASLSDGTYVSRQKEPSYGVKNPLNTGSEFFNLNTLKWYSDSNVEITPRTYLPYVVYADQNGQVTFVEEVTKVTHFEKIETVENRKVMYLADYGVPAIQINKKYVINNPFGNENFMDCDTKLEVYDSSSNRWIEVGHSCPDAGSSTNWIGAKSFSTVDGIIVQCSRSYIVLSDSISFVQPYPSTANLQSAPARVTIQYNGKTRRV